VYKVGNTMSQMSSVKCFLVNNGVLEVSNTSYSPDFEPANSLLFSRVERVLKEI
jgi:hypothetical protein